jgi:pentapeptide MXKDX repeat protein
VQAGIFGALQTVAKLLEAVGYFNFYDLKAIRSLRMPVTEQNFFQCRVTKAVAGASLGQRPMPPIGFQSAKRILSMTISTRITLGISAAALSLGLAFAPAAFAQDAVKKDDGMMKKDTMSKDDGMMKKDTMSKDTMKKNDSMMKKDDGMMKKDSMSK